MDIGQFAINFEGVWMDLRHPVTGDVLQDDAGNTARIMVVGTDSHQYTKILRESTNRRLRQGSRRMPAEEIEAEQVDMLVSCTLDVRGIDFEGEPVTVGGIRKIYENQQLRWIRDQVDAFISKRSNFISG